MNHPKCKGLLDCKLAVLDLKDSTRCRYQFTTLVGSENGVRQAVLCIRDIEDPYYKVNPADLKALQEIADDMKGQDVRSTSHPIYMVEDLEPTATGPLKVYVGIQPFFSSKAADQYIKDNLHNLDKPRVYVMSGHRNKEWQAIRQVLLQLNGEAK
jgi:hypothetical protein